MTVSQQDFKAKTGGELSTSYIKGYQRKLPSSQRALMAVKAISELSIVSQKFEGVSTVKRHQMIYNIVSEEL